MPLSSTILTYNPSIVHALHCVDFQAPQIQMISVQVKEDQEGNYAEGLSGFFHQLYNLSTMSK